MYRERCIHCCTYIHIYIYIEREGGKCIICVIHVAILYYMMLHHVMSYHMMLGYGVLLGCIEQHYNNCPHVAWDCDIEENKHARLYNSTLDL